MGSHHIAVVGCGWIGEDHIKLYRDLQGDDLTLSYVDCKKERADAMLEKYGGRNAWSSLAEALQDKGIGIVDICLPHALHLHALRESVAANKAIIMEKPLVRNMAEAAEARRILEGYDRPFMIAECWRFWPLVDEVKEMLDDNKFGTPFFIRGQSTNDWDPPGWRRDAEIMGGGSLLDRGIHFAAVLRYWGGPIETVYAHTHDIGAPDMTGEDTASVMVKFANGATGELFISWSTANPGPWTEWSVFGSAGSFYEHPGAGAVFSRRARDKEEPVPLQTVRIPDSEMIQHTLAHFLDCMDNDAAPSYTLDDAIEDLALVEAAYVSAATGEVVRFEEIVARSRP